MGGLIRSLVGITKAKEFLPADAAHQALQAGGPAKFQFQWKYNNTQKVRRYIV